MASSITCTYTLFVVGNVSKATLASAVQAAALDTAFMTMWGLRLVSDATTTPGGLTSIIRTIVLAMDAASPATVTVTTVPGTATGGPLNAATVTGAGSGYIQPPVLKVGGTGSGAVLQAHLGVQSVTINAGGSLYSANTKLIASGGELAPGGTQATFTLGFSGGGAINSVTVVNKGGPYNSPPTLTLTNVGTGPGASLTPLLGVTGVSVIQPGVDYGVGGSSIPVTVVPYFKTLCPDASGLVEQASSVNGFMLNILQAAANSPVQQTTVAS